MRNLIYEADLHTYYGGACEAGAPILICIPRAFRLSKELLKWGQGRTPIESEKESDDANYLPVEAPAAWLAS